MRYTTFYNDRDYNSFCDDTTAWDNKLQNAFKEAHMYEPQKYPVVLVWELVWCWDGSMTSANFSYIYIYRDSQLVKDLFSDLINSKQESRKNKTDSKRKKI